MEAEVYYHLIKYDKMNISKPNTSDLGETFISPMLHKLWSL